MKKPTNTSILKALRCMSGATAENPIHWRTITEKVRAEVAVTDWMKVRGVLQWLKNRGVIARVNDVHVEAYYVTKDEFNALTS